MCVLWEEGRSRYSESLGLGHKQRGCQYASIFDSGATTSTRITAPLGSAMGSAGPPRSDEDHSESITVISASRTARVLSIDLSPASLPSGPP
ncbi:uncharacterized protein B0H18DRAFT_651211 [Fomitopsis serialis]|uniref:uncharacterized protein n=1 Tax=Fomitopsis serialis TaxID=139415 RepID=UPI002008D7D1|nr:uncharacterized protein B0H18DRAFT_651211 [Neoantrodia serialis]KAH9919242.1 hypothetical protein B0H18DRAFT_651211 [Neoantrodia serialis]